MITVGLYKKTVKQAPNNETRSFFQRLDSVDLNKIIPQIQHDIKGVSTTFDYDEKFSKEVGHYCYVQQEKSSDAHLTPFVGGKHKIHNDVHKAGDGGGGSESRGAEISGSVS